MSTIKDFTKKRAWKLFKADNAISERFSQAVEIFNQQFGEEHIDVVNEKKQFVSYWTGESVKDFFLSHSATAATRAIIIKIDSETVTNELGLSTVIYDLFIKLAFRRDGTTISSISYKRSTFTENQLFSNYIHSHCQRFSTSSPDEWKSVCTGSGPINNSLFMLGNPSTPIEVFYGFIAELRQIVKVESLSGGPYIKIEHILGPYKEVNNIRKADSFGIKHPLKELLISYIKSDRMKFGYLYGRFCLGCTFVEWLIDFTQYAIAWGEKNHHQIALRDVTIKDNRICVITGTSMSEETIKGLIGKHVITFKGKEYGLKIIKSNTSTEQRRLISPAEGATILKAMLDTLNYWYGKNNENNETGDANVLFA